MGGADVKLLASAAVVVAPSMVPTLVVGTSLAGGILAFVYIIGSKLAPKPPVLARPAGAAVSKPGLLQRAARCELRRLRRRGPLPYAAAIATGGWLALAGS
jgi:prepilin peptidase CpaA